MADGVKMLERGPITATTVAETIMIDVSGRQSLQLTTLGSGYADWADARILVWSRPQLTDIARQPDGALKISGADAAGRRGVLLAATNLSSPTLWSAVATNTADDYGTLSFPAQPTTNHPQRFFRLQRP